MTHTITRMTFGAFMGPFHPVGENPTLSLERDLELIEWLDELGFDEAWVGEHHSAGWETISSPEVFLASAAERTRHTSAWEPGWCRCRTIIRIWWLAGWCCSTISRGDAS